MSIPVQTPFNLYIANGSTTVFPYRFLLNQASDLRVTANGKPATTGFQIDGIGNPSGGNIIFSVAPVSGTKISIIRSLPLRRDTEYQDNGDLLASTINADFDRIWMALQGESAVASLALSRPGQDIDYYDAKGSLISNVKAPVNAGDAVNKETLDTAVTYMTQQVSDAKNHLDTVNTEVAQNAGLVKKLQEITEDNATEAKNAANTAANTAASDTAQQLKIQMQDELDQAKTYAQESADSARSAEESKSGALQALKDAQEIAKTPGPQGEPGADGQSAYDLWMTQQPAGSDTSPAAFMAYMAGKKGDKGDKGDPGPKGDPGAQGTADLTGVKSTVPVPAGGFNQATKYPLYAHESASALPDHPLPGASGNAAWGVLWVNPRGGYPGQIFMNYDGQMFCRIHANYGWSSWWQTAGVPVEGYVGTERRLSCSSAVTYGKNVAGSTLLPPQSGTWFARGDAAAGEKITYMRIK
ncbi:hypothetical protein CFJ40_03870 [Salmonella enterica]|nr:hypothetical protein [Salmonella enterica]